MTSLRDSRIETLDMMNACVFLLATMSFSLIVFSPLATAADDETEAKPAADGEGFVPIFDGRTLEGWREIPAGDTKAWEVKDGAIVGDGNKGLGYLVYKNHELADFELKLSYRFPGKGNSGISVRARVDKTGRREFQSYHADLGHLGIGKQVNGAWDFHTPGRKEHSCFRGNRLVIDRNDQPTVTRIDGAVTPADISKGGWNEAHLIVKGNNFKFFINGKPASEFTEHLPEGKRLHKGMIQLQLHDPGMIVHFQDLRLKVTDEGRHAPTPADCAGQLEFWEKTCSLPPIGFAS